MWPKLPGVQNPQFSLIDNAGDASQRCETLYARAKALPHASPVEIPVGDAKLAEETLPMRAAAKARGVPRVSTQRWRRNQHFAV
jgi:hypothetical protein